MWPPGIDFGRSNNSFFSSPFSDPFSNLLGGSALGDPLGLGSGQRGFGNDLFSMNSNASIPMAQMLPFMMQMIVQQQLAMMFLAYLLANGGGQCQKCGRNQGGFPNGGWGGGRRLPPGSWNRNGRSNGTSGADTTPHITGGGGTVDNKTATFDRITNAGARNQMVHGRIKVNGREYNFRSGGGGRGNLPAGDYTVRPHLWDRSDNSMSVGDVGFSFALSDKYDSRVGANRSLLRIHPDGGGAGTIGCIGIVGDASTQAQFREDMRAELARNGGSFNLRVGAPPSYSPGTSPGSNGNGNGLISDRAADMIKRSEGYDQPGKWPGGSSGVTIGVGYDLGHKTRAQFRQDWNGRLPESTMQRLEGVIGLTGGSARAASHSLGDIHIPQNQADQVFQDVTLPRFYNTTAKAFPGFERLDDDAKGALVSLVFNRGASMSGDRRREMRGVRDAVARGDLHEAAQQIRQMKRLWYGQGLNGLLTRRDREADLLASGRRIA